MENVKLPTEKAQEPAEEAHQPMCMSGSTMSSQEESNKPKKRATFAENAMSAEKEPSQSSSAYKEALSQPPDTLSHRQRLVWLQRRRGPGLWAQCDACDAWRHLPHVVDSHQLPAKWYCSMNPDKSLADCKAAEAPLRITEEEDLIHSEYSCGSLVWARLPGWPWWPAMVDDCPDTEQFYWLDGFSDIPTHYNVVFFDASDATRAWITPENLKPYTANKNKFRHLMNSNQYKKRLQKALQEADKAEKLPVADRLAKFSFLSTFKGPIVSPKKVSKRDLERYQIKLKRKFNVDFPIEDTSKYSESDDESVQAFREKNKRNNVIIIGTPRSKKTKVTNEDNTDTVKPSVQTKQSENNKNDQRDIDVKEINNMQKPVKEKRKNIKNGIEKPESATGKKVNVFSVASTATTEHNKNEQRDNDVIVRNNMQESVNEKRKNIKNGFEKPESASGKKVNVFSVASTATTEHNKNEQRDNDVIVRNNMQEPVKEKRKNIKNGFEKPESATGKKVNVFSVASTATTEHNKNEQRDNDVKVRNNMQEPVKEKRKNIKNAFEKPESATGKNVNVFSVASTATTETCEQSFKLPDSMAIEIGSTQSLKSQQSQPEMTGIDNDSSKTYVPEEESDSVIITQDFHVRVASPSSDDFDF